MTERLGRPPVEDLSDFAWARVERSIWARMDTASLPIVKTRRVWPWIVVPAMLAAAIAIVVVVMPETDPKAPAIAAVDDEPTRVVSGASPSAVTFGDAHVALEANTAVIMDHDATRPTVMLEHGSAWFTVAPRGERPPFVVLAGDAVVRVIGTRFRVARDNEQVAVEVDHGIVEVAFRGTHVRLEANQRWSSDATAAAGGSDDAQLDPEVEMPAEPATTRAPHTKRARPAKQSPVAPQTTA